jgi:hydrogenase nickel incorporation protein HypA/HybF
MHEYSVAQALVGQVEREARRRDAVAVSAVHVRIGGLSGVVPELLEQAYTLCRAGTLCAGAELRVVAVPVEWECPSCGGVLAGGQVLQCASCGLPARLRQGDELVLERIEMEVADV